MKISKKASPSKDNYSWNDAGNNGSFNSDDWSFESQGASQSPNTPSDSSDWGMGGFDFSGDDWSSAPTPPRPPKKKKTWIWIFAIAMVVLCVAVFLLFGNRISGTEMQPSALSTVSATETVATTRQPASTPTSSAVPTATPTVTLSPAPTPTATPTLTATPSPTPTAAQSADLSDAYPDSLRWYYHQLNAQEQALYRILYAGLCRFEQRIDLTGYHYTADTLEKVELAMNWDCPELVQVDWESSWQCETSGEYVTWFSIPYAYATSEEAQNAYDRTIAGAKAIAAEAAAAQTDFEKEYISYRRLIRSYTYDMNSAHVANADAILVYGRGKCSAASDAFTLVCRTQGIPCITVTGDGINEEGLESHAWNMVQVNGQWLLCDSTWDQPVYESYAGCPTPISEALFWFNLPDSDYSSTHILGSEYAVYGWNLPQCVCEDYSYWNAIQPEALADSDWENQLIDGLNAVVRGETQVITLKFNNAKLYRSALDSIGDTSRNWSQKTGNSYSYSILYSDDQLVLWLWNFKAGRENSLIQQNLWVRFNDVGNADSIIVYCEGHYMLLDGGNSKDSSMLYSFLQMNGVQKLDAIIATHPHSDHVGGLSGALSYTKCGVGAIYVSALQSDNEKFTEFTAKAKERGLSLTVPSVGQSFALGSATVTFLGPDSAKHYDDTNNSSLIVRIEYGDTAFLFMGDAEENAEADLLQSGQNLKADVLKVGHHGSSGTCSDAFLQAVSCQYAVVCCKKNDTSHPAESTVSQLQKNGATIYTTGEKGTFYLFSDGKNLTLMQSN